MDRVEAIVIGAGVVGLAVARELARAGREVVVLESEGAIGTGTSARNSGVIHAGIYYPKGSLKALACVEGRRLLYAYAQERGIPHKRCGKLIVATDEAERAKLEQIAAAAAANGVDDMEVLDRRAALALEPNLACTGALLSPSTGIIDQHAYMLALQGDIEAAGGQVVLHSKVERGYAHDGGVALAIGGAEPFEIAARLVVNAGGLEAVALAHAIDGVKPESIPPFYLAKGNYFSLRGRSPFSRLVYPVPVPGGLGTHLTLDLGGQARFGPDVEWIDRITYDVDPRRGDKFYADIRRYWPGLPDDALQPEYCGIRPKISGPGEPAADFLIQGPDAHGLAGLISLFGIESPGLTSSLALARRVREMAHAVL